MRITKLTFLAFYLNGALDTGTYQGVTAEEVAKEIEKGSVFEFLSRRLSGAIDLSIFDNTDRAELLAEWQSLLNVIDAKRKLGVENNGLCLLMGYLLEGIQRRQDNNPKP